MWEPVTYGNYESEGSHSGVDEDSRLVGFNAVYEVCEGRRGHAAAQLVEALRHKPEDRGFDSR